MVVLRRHDLRIGVPASGMKRSFQGWSGRFRLKIGIAAADARPMPGPANRSGRVVGRLAQEGGFTLIEAIAVMVLMSILLAPIITSFVTTMSAQARQANVATAQEQARLALERMRKDIHCAHSAGAPLANASGGTTLILNETNASGVAECPGLLAQNASSVQWCTVPVSTNHYQLFREDDPSVECSGSQSTFQVDYLTQGSVWTVPGCVETGAYPTVNVSLSIDVSPGTSSEGKYNLGDQIALRNASPCS
jgi:type II secretory pathway pseudopilin PulG